MKNVNAKFIVATKYNDKRIHYYYYGNGYRDDILNKNSSTLELYVGHINKKYS